MQNDSGKENTLLTRDGICRLIVICCIENLFSKIVIAAFPLNLIAYCSPNFLRREVRGSMHCL